MIDLVLAVIKDRFAVMLWRLKPCRTTRDQASTHRR